jgi:membrane protease YdiL (CAAX protease family)
VQVVVFFVALVVAAAVLSAWAHVGQRNRSLAVALYVVLGAVSILMTITGLVLSGLVSRLLVAPDRLVGSSDLGAAGFLFLGVGLGVGLPLLNTVRRLLARVMPFDPNSKPDMVGLSVLLGLTLYLIATYLTGTSVAAMSVGITELVSQSIAFVLIAFLGVGGFINRNLKSSVDRLGLRVPTGREVLIAIALVLVAFLIAAAASTLMRVLQPELEREIEQQLAEMTERINSLRGALILGISAGVGEETLFRGAIQPRYGIIFTSIVFSLVHVQYGFSVVVLGVFFVSIMLGLERKRMNTVTAIITHIVYNTVALSVGAQGP